MRVLLIGLEVQGGELSTNARFIFLNPIHFESGECRSYFPQIKNYPLTEAQSAERPFSYRTPQQINVNSTNKVERNSTARVLT